MAKQLLPEAEQYAKQNNFRQIWRKFVRVMACIVVFCTTYALILPAITMEKETVCAMEEHAHTEQCYTQITTQSVAELACSYDSLGIHVHADGCRDGEGNLICGLSDYVLHAHDDSCGENCALPEISGHVHADACYQAVAAEPELVCGLEEAEAHTHAEGCYDAEGVQVCTLAETEGHTHTDACWQTPETEPELICGREEAILHSHGEACYDAEGVLICAQPVLEEHVHGESCFAVTEVAADTESLTCGMEESEAHAHTALCYGAWELVCGTEEHAHAEECYAAEAASDAETVPAQTDPATGLTEAEQARVDHVISLIEEMPSADDIDAKIAEFEEAEDYEGEEAWLTQAYQQVAYVYSQYSALTDAQKAQVTNADKLLEMEYIWSVTTLADSYFTSKIYWINGYSATSSDTATKVGGTTMFVNEAVNSSNSGFYYWVGAVVDWDNGYLRVKEILKYETNKTGRQASNTGFILLYYMGNAEGYPWSLAVGDYVTLDIMVPQTMYDLYGYNSNGYGDVRLSKTAPDFTITSDPTTVLQYQENGGRVAHTSEFIDLNVYNYNYDVNENWRSNRYYPGFQWPGGAYINHESSKQNGETTSSSLNIGIPNYWAHRQYVDSLSFGDSIVANHQYADSENAFISNANGKFGKAVNATSVAKVYDTDDAQETGRMNWLWYDKENSTDSYSNRPVGWSLKTTDTEGKAIQFKMNDNAPITVDSISLKYLFPYDLAAGTTNSNGVTKMNSQSVDGLFQVNPISGLYYYNSHSNHAQYSDNKFTLYEEIITPDFILYPFGNFLPFNDINTEATQVGAFNYSGGMKTYVDRTVYNLQKWMAEERNNPAYASKTDPFSIYGYSSRYQLGIMLNEYAESWHNAGSWSTVSSGQALKDFFSSTTGPLGASPTFPEEKLNNMYNIDWDQATDFFFGMDMTMNIVMPKDGLTGKDNGNNTTGSWTVLEDGTFIRTGEADDIPDYPMVFNFAGDDDVWAYIDGLLFLDLTGIHRHVGGTIDFQTGMVYYFGLDTATGDTSNNTANADYYFAETFEEIIMRSFASSETTQRDAMLATLRPVLNADGSQRYFENDPNRPMKTFQDYTTHTFRFFYMERGSGSSVCRLNFNFPLLRQNTLSVEKEVTADTDIKALGDPDFKFQVLKVVDGVKTEEQFLPGDWAYSLYDADGSVIQEIKVSSKYPDGRVKEMTIVDKEGTVLCAETYDSNGNRLTQTGSGLNKVLRLGKNGIFTLKAGQRAEFVGIPEKAGKYYVRELLDEWDNEQYGTVSISVSGVVTERHSVYIDGVEFKGVESPILDMTNGSSTFTFQNKITTSKLGKLEISKQIDKGDYTGNVPGTDFTFAVTLDDQLLPEGTEYTVLDSSGHTVETRTVGSDGCVTIARDQTARIENILAGAVFRVTEQEASTKGYTVSYRVGDSDTTTTDHADGTIGVNSAVKVTVTNKISSAKVSIPVNKRFAVHDGKEHTYTFHLTQVADAQGTAISGAPTQEKTVTFDAATGTFNFELGYASNEFDSLPQTRYYLITEDDAADSMKNGQKFIAEIVIDETDTGLSATLNKMYSNTGENGAFEEYSQKSADFVNTLVGDLVISKTVSGSNTSQAFTFEIELPGTEEYPATRTKADGTTGTVTLTFTENKATFELAHGESLKLQGLPYGTEWKVTEVNTGGFIVSTVTASGTGSGAETSGSIAVGGNAVAYTNTQTYVLPETGGAGTTSYAMAGLMLMLCSAAYLLYRFKKRGREVI